MKKYKYLRFLVLIVLLISLGKNYFCYMQYRSSVNNLVSRTQSSLDGIIFRLESAIDYESPQSLIDVSKCFLNMNYDFYAFYNYVDYDLNYNPYSNISFLNISERMKLMSMQDSFSDDDLFFLELLLSSADEFKSDIDSNNSSYISINLFNFYLKKFYDNLELSFINLK